MKLWGKKPKGFHHPDSKVRPPHRPPISFACTCVNNPARCEAGTHKKKKVIA